MNASQPLGFYDCHVLSPQMTGNCWSLEKVNTVPRALLASDKIGKRSEGGRFWVDTALDWRCSDDKLKLSASSKMDELKVQRVDFGHGQLIGVFKVLREDVLTEKKYRQEALNCILGFLMQSGWEEVEEPAEKTG